MTAPLDPTFDQLVAMHRSAAERGSAEHPFGALAGDSGHETWVAPDGGHEDYETLIVRQDAVWMVAVRYQAQGETPAFVGFAQARSPLVKQKRGLGLRAKGEQVDIGQLDALRDALVDAHQEMVERMAGCSMALTETLAGAEPKLFIPYPDQMLVIIDEHGGRSQRAMRRGELFGAKDLWYELDEITPLDEPAREQLMSTAIIAYQGALEAEMAALDLEPFDSAHWQVARDSSMNAHRALQTLIDVFDHSAPAPEAAASS